MKVKFDWVEELGVPGAFIIKNHHQNEFYLKTLTLEDVPGHGRVLFICNSWVYPEIDRIFFTNQAYLPSETPATLRWYREKELENLRGDGLGQLEEWDRVYDYDAYNDLGNPDEGSEYYRPVLGGSTEYPYPRRGRTGRTGQTVRRTLASCTKRTSDEFDTFQGVIELFERKFTVSEDTDKMLEIIPSEFFKKFIRTNGEAYLKFPMPKVIEGSGQFEIEARKALWELDSLLADKKDEIGYELPLEPSVEEPLAIELSRPHPDGDQCVAISKVYTPAERGVEGSTWQLAKAYVSINDYGYHELISHWLNTHAVIEPFVIATNRQLSVDLLSKYFFPAKFSMEFSSMVYKDWVFPEQSLPADLIKRGVAIEDSNSPHGLRLLIEDYPYAVDGLQIWSAIKTWVEDYCSFYCKNNEMVQNDSELQSWWEELREKGHADKKDEPWWPKMETCKELIETCTIIIWVASAVHAAVNFGQYPYAGYLPNRPSLSRRFMPEPDTPEYHELERNPEKAFLKTITAKKEALRSLFLVEILSKHSSDELYLGHRDNPEWAKDTEPLRAFKKFGEKQKEIEERITEMNTNPKWKNRVGPVKVPYTLLYPTGEDGLSGKGIPNSTSI
ncbi:hypothetical protein F0562_019988 [Nyssa sinensis]|uniref:Lipoxygenase n=1 Tax=Nyssa sinensis TaxID=561372 RepID=A0A5J5BPP8_9ASTE|nr:hypothetical protein F0562_019988 [Nyssa sinensis]